MIYIVDDNGQPIYFGDVEIAATSEFEAYVLLGLLCSLDEDIKCYFIETI